LQLDGATLDLRAATARPRVLAYHKPEGEIVSRDDPEGRRTVFERLPQIGHGRWISIGRLDLNSAGLLLLTDSGELANRLMHPRHGVEREYAVRVSRQLTASEMDRLRSGVQLDDGLARFLRIEAGDKREGANRWYRVTLAEGRNREVRRMLEALGVQVSRLLRIRMGPVRLPRDLKPGRWVELADAEVQRLLAIQPPQGVVR
jgi:23S rRNA pseudouridine2605 synthase